jgi:hypothetical protein
VGEDKTLNMEKLTRIGEVNFEDYKSEFFITEKTKKFLKEKGISLASLLPNGWIWYEVILFDSIDNNSKLRKFKIIYNGIVERRNLTKEGYTEESSQKDVLKIKEKKVLSKGVQGVNDPKGKDYLIKYILMKE